MKLSPKYLVRYQQIARLFWKYGRLDFRKEAGLDEGDTPLDEDEDTKADQLPQDLESMGPTYVKLGQVLSGRPDLLPEPYLKSLARLQDNVKPFGYEEVEKIITEQLGVRISKAFSRFDSEPLAAASLGQVHAAALRDGRAVVVKVQRPGISTQIAEDFEVLEEIAEFLEAHTEIGRKYRFRTMLEEFRISIRHELNYEREAQNLITVGENLKEFKRIQVPQPVLDYSTRSVLTMDAVSGCKITALGALGQMELDGAPLAEEVFRAYLKQVLSDGIFHADPHPGNVFVTDEGKIALLDLGMVGTTTPTMQEHLLKLLLAISEGQSEDVADIVLRISRKNKDADTPEFRSQISRMVAERQNQSLRDLNVGKAVLDVSRNAAENGIMVPSELTLLGKTLLQLDEVGQILDPDFDPSESIRRNTGELLRRRMMADATQGSVLTTLLDMKEFLTGLPNRLNQLMDGVANNEIEIKVKATDAKDVMEGFQKIANRITMGVILGSLILGACILMRVETEFQLFGFPGLAILCFLAAATGGIYLVISILVQDHRKRKDPDWK